MDNSPETDFQQIALAASKECPGAALYAHEARNITRAVIQKLIDITPSPRTVVELTRILNTETLVEPALHPKPSMVDAAADAAGLA